MSDPRISSFGLSLVLFSTGCAGSGTIHGSGGSTGVTGGANGGTSSMASAGTGGASTGAGGTPGSGGTGGAGGGSSASSASSGGTKPACPCFDGDGLYCESVAGSYAAAHDCSIGTATSDDLMSCTGGSWSVHMACSNGCTVNPGKADACTPSCGSLNLQQFIAKWTGMCTGYPGWSPPNQCTDLALQWVANLCLPVQFSGNAVNWAGENVAGFTWVKNAPGIVPSPGDLVIFGPVGMTCNDGVGSAGHVDVAVSASAQSSTWQGFDQNWQTNWNGTCYPPQVVNHNWSECVIGWQHLTIPLPP